MAGASVAWASGHDESAALDVGRHVTARISSAVVTVSAGVAAFPAAERNELQRAADRALYRAKESGKNTVRGDTDAGLAPLAVGF